MNTINEARAMLPRVGDTRWEVPTIPDKNQDRPAQECEVVEVNAAHLWYRVRFKKSGFTECYKVPRLKPVQQGGPSR